MCFKCNSGWMDQPESGRLARTPPRGRGSKSPAGDAPRRRGGRPRAAGSSAGALQAHPKRSSLATRGRSFARAPPNRARNAGAASPLSPCRSFWHSAVAPFWHRAVAHRARLSLTLGRHSGVTRRERLRPLKLNCRPKQIEIAVVPPIRHDRGALVDRSGRCRVDGSRRS